MYRHRTCEHADIHVPRPLPIQTQLSYCIFSSNFPSSAGPQVPFQGTQTHTHDPHHFEVQLWVETCLPMTVALELTSLSTYFHAPSPRSKDLKPQLCSCCIPLPLIGKRKREGGRYQPKRGYGMNVRAARDAQITTLVDRFPNISRRAWNLSSDSSSLGRQTNRTDKSTPAGLRWLGVGGQRTQRHPAPVTTPTRSLSE